MVFFAHTSIERVRIAQIDSRIDSVTYSAVAQRLNYHLLDYSKTLWLACKSDYAAEVTSHLGGHIGTTYYTFMYDVDTWELLHDPILGQSTRSRSDQKNV